MFPSRWRRSPFPELCSPTFCGLSRNFDHHPLHQPRKAFDLLRVRAKLTGEARLDEEKFGNCQRSAWRRLVPSPSTARANGAGVPKTRKRGNLANDPAEMLV